MANKQPKQYTKKSKAAKLSKRQLYGIAAIAVIVVSLLGVYAFFTQASGTELKAAIVDQLSSRQDFVNATFVKTADAILTAAGYTVTYYNGSEVNVNFYRNLPLQGYKLIIFRVHTALGYNRTSGQLLAPLDLFTAEPYVASNYASDQLLGYLDVAMYQPTAPKSDWFFGIKPLFISSSGGMQGRFDDTVIIMMGCNGLDKLDRSRPTLEAFMHRGAKAIIGWDDAVGVDHTDMATNLLLGHLLIENQNVRDAVNATRAEVGPDPTYHGALTYYPYNSTIGNYVIPHSSSKTVNLTDGFFMLGSMTFIALPQISAVKKFYVSE